MYFIPDAWPDVENEIPAVLHPSFEELVRDRTQYDVYSHTSALLPTITSSDVCLVLEKRDVNADSQSPAFKLMTPRGEVGWCWQLAGSFCCNKR